MSSKFSITYEIVTPESAEQGEAANQGFHLEDLRFRDAYEELRSLGAVGCHCEADSYPLRWSPPRWFSFVDVSENYATGEVTSYALHIPENITSASRMRIARLLRCYGSEQ